MYIHINSNGSRIMAGFAFGIKNVLHLNKNLARCKSVEE